MSDCEDCDLELKLITCCRKHPETNEERLLPLPNGKYIWACPNLNTSEECSIYPFRPKICKEYSCIQSESVWEEMLFKI